MCNGSFDKSRGVSICTSSQHAIVLYLICDGCFYAKKLATSNISRSGILDFMPSCLNGTDSVIHIATVVYQQSRHGMYVESAGVVPRQDTHLRSSLRR